MATKNEISEQAGSQLTDAAVNNSFVNGIVKVLQDKQKLGLTFPADYNYNNELLGAYLIMSETKDRNGKSIIETCSKQSIVQTLMDMVTAGVSMQKKQCYPVAYGGKLQCQMSVYGNTCVARRYGLEKISASVIYDGDTFEYHLEDGEIVIDKHTQNFLNIDPDKIIGAYAVAVMKDGYKHVELMNMPMIKKAWAQGFGYKDGEGVHKKFADQMAIKTVKNRCLKFIIRTYCTSYEVGVVDDMENREGTDTVVADVDYEIANNANTVDFDEQEVIVEPAPAKQPAPKAEPQQSTLDFLQD